MSAGGPERIQIVPDDYHTEHVGVTPDGRQVFATSELFAVVGVGEMRFFAAAFVWTADGEFERLEVRDASRPRAFRRARPWCRRKTWWKHCSTTSAASS